MGYDNKPDNTWEDYYYAQAFQEEPSLQRGGNVPFYHGPVLQRGYGLGSIFKSVDYKTCLFSDSIEYRSQLIFRLAKHEVHSIVVNKVALNRDDDKRISRKDGISTFVRGHKDLSWSPLLGVLSLI